jgi:hypothetical protein
MFKIIIATLFSLAFLVSSAHAEPPHAKISALASGALLLNGQPADLASIEAEFKRLQAQHGEVWYHRDNPRAEPTRQAMSVIQLVIKYRLPITFSTKPDFSDYVDVSTGRSHPRSRKR